VISSRMWSSCASKPAGRPRLPLDDVLYCAVQRCTTNCPSDVPMACTAVPRPTVDSRTIPSVNMVSEVLRRADVTPILHELIAKAALPLASIEDTFAVDSSGFRTTSFGDYCREKYGAPTHNVWLKASIIVGTRSHIIPRVVVTDGHSADSPQLPELVNGVVDAGFILGEVYADKGYLSAENFTAVGKRAGRPTFCSKRTVEADRSTADTTLPGGSRCWHRFQSDPADFHAHYSKRENVEATFAAIKKKLGETLKSRNPRAQINELLCKILAYDISVLIHESFERGIQLPGADLVGSQPKIKTSTEAESDERGFRQDMANRLWQGGDN